MKYIGSGRNDSRHWCWGGGIGAGSIEVEIIRIQETHIEEWAGGGRESC